MLEHQPEPGAQPALSRARPAQVLATRDHGRGDLQRPEGRAVPEPSGKVTTISFTHLNRAVAIAACAPDFARFRAFHGHFPRLSLSLETHPREISETKFRAVNRIKSGVASRRLTRDGSCPNYVCIRRFLLLPPLFPFKECAKKNFIIRWIFAARRDKLN